MSLSLSFLTNVFTVFYASLFLADRINCHAYATVLRPSVVVVYRL